MRKLIPLKTIGIAAFLLASACSQVNVPNVGENTSGLFDGLTGGKANALPDENGIIDNGTYRSIIVNRGDDLGAVAARAGVSTQALAAHNGLPPNYIPKAGEQLAIPKIVATPSTPIGFSAPSTESTIKSSTLETSTPQSHTVIAGETIFEVARLYNVPVASLASVNGLNADLNINPGQVLTIPTGQTGNQTASLAPVDTPAVVETPIVDTTPPVAVAPATTSSGFSAPVSGSISKGFDPGANSDGYIYSTATQAPVNAVNSGKVVLVSESTGDQGTVVMVQHPNGLISIYGRMGNLKVSKGDQISAGQNIGTTESSELMFQLRRGTAPVNPADYF